MDLRKNIDGKNTVCIILPSKNTQFLQSVVNPENHLDEYGQTHHHEHQRVHAVVGSRQNRENQQEENRLFEGVDFSGILVPEVQEGQNEEQGKPKGHPHEMIEKRK